LVALLLVLVCCQSVEEPFDKRWGEPESIETGPAGVQRAQIAIDAMGNAIAVWDQTDRATGPVDDSEDIWSNRCNTEGQWGTAELLESHEPENSLEAQIAVDGEGNAVVAFRQSDGEYFRIWAVRYTPRDGWDDPERIQSDVVGDAGRIQIAADAPGNAVVVWQQVVADEDERLVIWSNRFTVGTGWGVASLVETDANDLVAPQVAMDDNGNAIAVWERSDGARSSVWSKRQTPTGEWLELQNVETDDSGNAFLPQVAADAEGNAIAVWQQQTDGTRFDIWSNLYRASPRHWGDAERIEHEDSGNAEKPQIAMDGNGNALAVWVLSGGERAGIWSNRYVANAGWGAAAPIGPTGLGSARSPQVTSNLDGDAVAVWVQFDGVTDSVWSNRYTASGGWGRSEAIKSEDPRRANGPQVAVDFAGDAVAIWSQGGNLWSNRLATPAPGSGTK
jgi:hypothetical protein